MHQIINLNCQVHWFERCQFQSESNSNSIICNPRKWIIWKGMTTVSLTTTQPPSTPAWQPSEHTLNSISSSVESKLVTNVIIRFFTALLFFFLLLVCFFLILIWQEALLLLSFCVYKIFTFCAPSTQAKIPTIFICPPSQDNNKMSICVEKINILLCRLSIKMFLGKFQISLGDSIKSF